jgi:hypothetical protein
MSATAKTNLADALTRRIKPRDNSPSSVAIMTAFADLRIALLAMTDDVPQLPVTCRPDDLSYVGEHIVAFAKTGDAYLKVLGEELQRNATAECKVDMTCFQRAFESATAGLADFEARRAADILSDERAEFSRAG